MISTLLLQSHPMLSIGRGKAPAVLHPCFGQTDTPFALTPDSQSTKETFVQQCRNVVCPISIKSFSQASLTSQVLQFDIGVVIEATLEVLGHGESC